MSALVCPRCQRANPDAAAFCYFDGAELRARAGGAAAPLYNRMAQEFVFPSGRRCRTYDELAQACEDDWSAAKGLLKQGAFRQFFAANGRADLVRATQEAMALPDADMGLTTFVGALPASKVQTPRLDLSPRRILLGNLLAGETRQVPLTVSNEGQGTLQGTLTVSEGGDWLKIAGASNGQAALKTPRTQQLTLQVDTRGLPSLQTYGAKLTVVTNGGVAEVPVRMDLVPHGFSRPPFQGVKAPREMAERMRSQPKAAVPLMESGEIARWFAANGWDFPVRGPQARGVAGIQQFFEAMGLSRPPAVQVSQADVRLRCQYPEVVRHRIRLHTSSRKWVYAHVESDSPWLRVLTPDVSGPQQTAVDFEADAKLLPAGGAAKGRLLIVANAGQTLPVHVIAEGEGVPRPPSAARGLLQPVLAMALAFFLVRLLLVPVLDFIARPAAARAAAAKVGHPVNKDSRLSETGGWLSVPWGRIFFGTEPTIPADRLQPTSAGEVATRELLQYFAGSFVRTVVLLTWWVGAVLGAWYVVRRGAVSDLPWGLIAGAVAGVAGAATLACVILGAEAIPLWVWGTSSPGLALLVVWVIWALLWWTAVGAGVALILGLVAPWRRAILRPVQDGLANLFRICGLRGLARAWSAS
jgi:hypothetical protein